MSRWAWAVCLAWGLWGPAAGAAPGIHKCVVDGAVTYQQDPCTRSGARQAPTVAQLNAERQRRLRETAMAPAAASAPLAGAGGTAPPRATAATPDLRPAPRVGESAPPLDEATAPPPFRCDGRRFCSQMRSCDEARFFVANCPDTRMDGNRDGQPCQRQWCGPS